MGIWHSWNVNVDVMEEWIDENTMKKIKDMKVFWIWEVGSELMQQLRRTVGVTLTHFPDYTTLLL